MRRFWVVVLAGLLIAALTPQAFAWEFSMSGEFVERFRYFSRTGPKDLFGRADNINDETVGFAGPWIYGIGQIFPPGPNLGNIITRQGFALVACDAMYNDSRLTLRPMLKINQAVTVHGQINIGGYRNRYNQNAGSEGIPTFERWNMHSASWNSSDSTEAIASWEQVRAVVRVPWGVLSYGSKSLAWGCGSWAHGDNTDNHTFLVVTPYGPFRFLCGVDLARSFATGPTTVPDRSDKPQYFGLLGLTYRNGPIDVGAITYDRWTHFDLSTGMSARNILGTGSLVMADDEMLTFDVYFKYNNGRFFANAEYFLFDRSFHYTPAPGETPCAPQYLKGYNFFSEVGALVGPAKLSLVYAQGSGMTRNASRDHLQVSVNSAVLAPYNWLMFEMYGGGNQQFVNAVFTAPYDKGSMSDAYCFGARLDYASASNLNCWTSFIWAHRLERAGYYMGHFNNTGRTASQAERTAFMTNIGVTPVPDPWDPTGVGEVAFIPDGYIGYEIGIGLDWKLLENFTWTHRYAYWQPGDWFTYAYQARVGGADSQVMVGRDAIHGYETTLVIEF